MYKQLTQNSSEQLYFDCPSSLQRTPQSFVWKATHVLQYFHGVQGIGALAIQLMHYLIVVNSQAICHTTTIIFALTFSGSEMFATDIIYHSAYIMYCCYHLKSEISKKRSEYLFRCYTGYAGFTLILLFFVTITYDWRNGIGKYTILENGHCSFVDTSSYNTLFLTIFIITNKFLQLMFIAYLFYLYKFNLNVRAAQVTL